MGTFTIANLGMYGITNFSAVIHPQQVNFWKKIFNSFFFLSRLFWLLVVLIQGLYPLQTLRKGIYHFLVRFNLLKQ
jgi:hypothetical protein